MWYPKVQARSEDNYNTTHLLYLQNLEVLFTTQDYYWFLHKAIALHLYRDLSHLTFIGKINKIIIQMQGEWVEIEVMHAREWNSAAQKD